jgi:hypothetical protein
VGGGALLDGLGEVLPQVEPVGDLDRVRCPGPGAVGVGARPVAADDLDPGVGCQPAGQRLGVTALDEAGRRAGLDVDEQRAVMLAAPDREVVQLLRHRSKSIYPDRGIIPTGGAAVWWMPWWRAGS